MPDEAGVKWETFYSEMMGLRGEMADRDRAQMDLLSEIRDSLGDVHLRFEALNCDSHKTVMSEMNGRLDALEKRLIDWPRIVSIAPRIPARWVLASLGLIAAGAGWDWWDRFAGMLERWK